MNVGDTVRVTKCLSGLRRHEGCPATVVGFGGAFIVAQIVPGDLCVATDFEAAGAESGAFGSEAEACP